MAFGAWTRATAPDRSASANARGAAAVQFEPSETRPLDAFEAARQVVTRDQRHDSKAPDAALASTPVSTGEWRSGLTTGGPVRRRRRRAHGADLLRGSVAWSRTTRTPASGGSARRPLFDPRRRDSASMANSHGGRFRPQQDGRSRACRRFCGPRAAAGGEVALALLSLRVASSGGSAAAGWGAAATRAQARTADATGRGAGIVGESPAEWPPLRLSVGGAGVAWVNGPCACVMMVYTIPPNLVRSIVSVGGIGSAERLGVPRWFLR
jgi:hypothetical protein